jgi:hypothetical protein
MIGRAQAPSTVCFPAITAWLEFNNTWDEGGVAIDQGFIKTYLRNYNRLNEYLKLNY